MSAPLSHHTTGYDELSAGLACCEYLLAEHVASATRVYGNHGLGMVDLPPLDTPGRVVPAQVNSGAVLYWCAEVDHAGVLQFVESLAEKVYRGQISLPIQQSADKLRPFWKSAEHRFTAPERQLIYRQVLDNGIDGQFHHGLQQVVEALVAIGRESVNQTVLHHQTRAAYQIHDLARGLSDRAVGITGFAARDIVRQIRDAMSVLQDPEINQALGGGSIGYVLQRWAPALIGYPPQVSNHLQLAQYGVEILRWAAQEAGQIVANSRILTRHHPVIRYAEAWLAVAQGLQGGLR